MRTTSSAVGLILLLACVACSGDERSPDVPSPATSPPTLEHPQVEDIESDSSDLLQAAVASSLAASSYQATISFSISQDGGGVQQYTGEMYQRAPSDLFMKLRIDDETVEFLALPPDLYIRQEGGSWCFVPDDAADEFKSLAEGQSIKEFADLLTNLDDVQTLDEETIAGVSYTHLRGTFDLRTYLESLPPNQVDRDALEGANFIRPGTVGVYIDPRTNLMGRLAMVMEIATPDGNGTITFHADFDAYNDTLGFPAEPEGALEYEESSGASC